MFLGSRKKRGELSYVLTHLLGLIVAVVIAFALLFIGLSIYRMFFKDIDKATENNFNRLTESIDKMIEHNFKIITVPYYIHPDYTLFGFNKYDMYIEQTGGFMLNPSYERPLERCPIDSSCLCIYNRIKKKFFKCYSNSTIESFVVSSEYPLPPPSAGRQIENENDLYLAIHGKAKINSWGVENIMIEKITNPDKSYTFVFQDPHGEETVREDVKLPTEREKTETEQTTQTQTGEKTEAGETGTGEQTETEEDDTLTFTSLSGLLEMPVDSSDDGFPTQTNIDRFNSEAYKSGGKTRGQLILEIGTEYGVHPAILAAVAQKESSMGNAACYHGGKSSLTGCGWPTSCANGCACNNKHVWSDELQLRCTANTYRTAFEAASTGKAGSTYTQCYKYSSNSMTMWNCILCTYVHGFKDETSCSYANDMKDLYSQWYNYLQTQVGKPLSQENTASACRSSNLYLDYMPVKQGTPETNFVRGTEDLISTKDVEGEGTHISTQENAPVYAAKSGFIKNLGCDENLGNFIMVQGDNEAYYYYFHLNGNADLFESMKIPGGTLIGYAGTTKGCLNGEGIKGRTSPGVSIAIYQNYNINNPLNPYSYLVSCMGT